MISTLVRWVQKLDRKTVGILFTLLLALFTLSIIGISTTYEGETRLVPLMFALVLLFALLTILVVQVSPSFVGAVEKKTNLFEGGIQTDQIAAGDEEDEERDQLAALRTTVWTVGLFVLVYLIGFLNAIFVFSMLFYRFEAHQNWKRTVLYSILITVSILVLFQVVLQTTLYEGYVVDLLGLD